MAVDWTIRTWGRADAPPAVLLHGFLGCGADWAGIARDLARTYHVICPDLPGHGDTDGAPATLDDTAAAWIAWMDRQRLARVALAGYSMGGRLALFLALRFPDRFSHVLLESASPGIEDAAERAQRAEADARLAHELEQMDGRGGPAFRAWLERWYEQPLFSTLAPALRAGLVEKRLDTNQPGRLAAALRAMSAGRQPNLWPQLPRLTVPALAIVGERDRKFTGIARAMAERCPAMSSAIAADCGHNVHLEAADEYTSVLRRFLGADGA